jgi:hypothetical protein
MGVGEHWEDLGSPENTENFGAWIERFKRRSTGIVRKACTGKKEFAEMVCIDCTGDTDC